MGINITKEQKAGMFMKLASLPLYDVGIHYGLDKHYSSPKSVKNKVYNIYRQVLENPEEYGIQDSTLKLVEDAVQTRAVSHRSAQPTVAEKNSEEKDIKELLTENRDMAALAINKKLSKLKGKKLDAVSFSQLGTLFGILFDKSQIIQGEATEHVAMMGRIESDMNPEDALNMVVKMREQTVAEKHSS